MPQFQESLGHVKKLIGFSVTMENVSTKAEYAILAMTVETSDESMKDGAFCGRCILNRLIERLCSFMSDSSALYVTTPLILMPIGSVVVET